MSDKTVIQFRVRFPMMESPDRVYAVQLDRESAKCLLPLPRDHDAPFEFVAARIAAEQRKERTRLRGHVMEMLSDALDKIFAEEDTVNGYKQSELPPLWPISGAGNVPNPEQFRREYQGKLAPGRRLEGSDGG